MAQEIKMSAAGLKAMQEELEYLKTVRRKERPRAKLVTGAKS